MPQSENESFNYLLSLISNYLMAKENLWDIYVSKIKTVSVYYDALEQFKKHYLILLTTLDNIDRMSAVVQHQKIACHSMIDALLKENDNCKYFTRICCKYLKSQRLTAEEEALIKSMRKYCAKLPTQPDMTVKKFFSKNGDKQDITFSSSFTVVDGTSTHRYPPTAMVKVPRIGTYDVSKTIE